jgi:Family of unknown function (DUF6011)
MAWTDPPTDAQLKLLYGLASDRIAEKYGTCGEERIEAVGAIVENREGTMTRRDISQWIDWFKKQPWDRTDRPAVSAATGPDNSFDPQSLDIGVYERPDGELYLVKLNRERTYKYAKHAVTSTERATEGKTVIKLSFAYEKAAIRTLRPEMRMSAERALALSIEFGNCICCGHTIWVADSVLRGIGPVCLTKYFSEEEQAKIKAEVKRLKAEMKDHSRELEGASA